MENDVLVRNIMFLTHLCYSIQMIILLQNSHQRLTVVEFQLKSLVSLIPLLGWDTGICFLHSALFTNIQHSSLKPSHVFVDFFVLLLFFFPSLRINYPNSLWRSLTIEFYEQLSCDRIQRKAIWTLKLVEEDDLTVVVYDY